MANDTAKRYCENLQGEVDGAALYRALADAEVDEKLAEVYRRLAAVEDQHTNIGGVSFVVLVPVSRASRRAFAPARSAGLHTVSVPSLCCQPSTRSNRQTAASTTNNRKQ